MEKIFSALRDEIYDQINLITKRKKLSAREKEAVEKLTQALEVSETLIEKEVKEPTESKAGTSQKNDKSQTATLK
jgi:hypothetical protein